MGQVSTNLFSKSFTYSQAKNYRSILVVLGQAFANNCRWHLDPYWAHTALLSQLVTLERLGGQNWAGEKINQYM
jgi:hypothetical protein